MNNNNKESSNEDSTILFCPFCVAYTVICLKFNLYWLAHCEFVIHVNEEHAVETKICHAWHTCTYWLCFGN